MNYESAEITQIRSAYPELRINSAQRLTDSGQFSTIIVINKALIFRFPRSQATAHEMIREVQLLASLQERLPLPIPNPRYVSTDPESKLVRFMGYEMLDGVPITADTLTKQPPSMLQGIAEQLADFLRTLHAIPPNALNIELTVGEPRDEWLTLYNAFREELYPFMRLDAQRQVSSAFEMALNDLTLWQFTPVLRHGDFGIGNILFDPQTLRVSGVIDFTACGLGDPAQDVGAVWSLGDDFMTYFFGYYPEMKTTLRRVAFIRSTYALQQALYALRDFNQEDFEDGLRDYRAST